MVRCCPAGNESRHVSVRSVIIFKLEVEVAGRLSGTSGDTEIGNAIEVRVVKCHRDRNARPTLGIRRQEGPDLN